MAPEDLRLITQAVYSPASPDLLASAKSLRRMVLTRFPMAYGSEAIDLFEIDRIGPRIRGMQMSIDFDRTNRPLSAPHLRGSRDDGLTNKVWTVGLSLRAPILMAIQFEPKDGVLTPVVHMDKALRAWSQELAAALHVRAMDGFVLWGLPVDVDPFESDRLMPTDDPDVPPAFVWLFGE